MPSLICSSRVCGSVMMTVIQIHIIIQSRHYNINGNKKRGPDDMTKVFEVVHMLSTEGLKKDTGTYLSNMASH